MNLDQDTNKKPVSWKTRLFLTLWLPGMAGVFSLWLVDLSAFLATLTLPPGTEAPAVTFTLRLLILIQPTVFLTLATLAGVALASRVGLSAPVAQSPAFDAAASDAAASGQQIASALRTQISSGFIGGLAGGVAIIVFTFLWKPFLTPGFVKTVTEFSKFIPLPTRLLYGGITEELLMRWGLMTLLIWAQWRLFQKGKNKPRQAMIVSAILVSSVVFGIGHLPVASLMFPQLTTGLILYIIVANSMFGLIAGYLYWKKGLESAMIAHMFAHLVMFAASHFGMYF